MSQKSGVGLIVAVLVMLVVQPVAAELTDAEVRRAIESGREYLKKEQKVDGRWNEHSIYTGGVTALVTLALLSSGEDVKSPPVQKALGYLRSLDPPTTVYAASLMTMVFCAAEPEKDRLLISRNVQWLESVQVRGGTRPGAWGYSDSGGAGSGGDNSNTQFALLALHEAERIGVEVQNKTWEAALDYWLRTQREDGSWGYTEEQPATGSMTCAGIGCVVICSEKVRTGSAVVSGGHVECCGTAEENGAVDRALQWLGKRFSATRNPSATNLLRQHVY